MKLAIVSLGCPKNQVDADVFCHALIKAGHTTVPQKELADIIIINTCGFIQSAKEEAIEQILDACALKEYNPNLKVVVTGCLAERYKEEVAKELPEVDAVVGIGKNTDLPTVIQRICELDESGNVGENQPTQLELYGPKTDLKLGGDRVIGTPRHYAWLKIAEGCSNACSYCAIPMIRGPLRSRPMEDCLEEARWLAGQGVTELVLVAQDVSAFGEDTGSNQIVPLLEELNKIEGIRWIRILYAYPERITEELLDCMVRNKKVVHYLDLPIQHCNDEVLASMRRRGTNLALRKTIELIRKKMPDAILRTTFIAGYPGETEAQFEELCNFAKEMEFDRLGCFAYSPEDGTLAAKMPGQLEEEERARRADIVMELQSRIMLEKQENMVGKTIQVVCDELDEDEGAWLCRSGADAPEIDANVLLAADQPLEIGGYYMVEVTAADGYDLIARFVSAG